MSPRTVTLCVLALAALAAIPAVAAARSSDPSAGASASRTVLVKDNKFSPSTISVSRGTTINFVWRGRVLHNVAVGNSIKIPNRKSGVKALRVNRTVTLNCTLHRPGMILRVQVR